MSHVSRENDLNVAPGRGKRCATTNHPSLLARSMLGRRPVGPSMGHSARSLHASATFDAFCWRRLRQTSPVLDEQSSAGALRRRTDDDVPASIALEVAERYALTGAVARFRVVERGARD